VGASGVEGFANVASVNYNQADIDQARQSIGSEAGKFGSVGDGVPQNVDAGMFGKLGNSGAAASAASALCSALRTEYTKAESLIGNIERAMDSMGQNQGETEAQNKDSFQA
jgi:hypothetical protein